MLTSTVAFVHYLRDNRRAEVPTDVRHFSDVRTGAIIFSWQQWQTPAVLDGKRKKPLAQQYWFRATVNKCEIRPIGKRICKESVRNGLKRLIAICLFFFPSYSDELLGEHGARRQIQRGLAREPEVVAVPEIRHGLVPVQGGWKHDRLHLQPE